MAAGRVAVTLDGVDDRSAFAAAMAGFGIGVHFVSEQPLDVRRLREALDMTREQFALLFNLPMETVEKWETGARTPDAGSLAYLRVIAMDPTAAMKAQEMPAASGSPVGL